MLTNLADRTVNTFGTAETADFTIKANGKAFKVLIDGLYSDKIRAVVRELWTNAFDSHAISGKSDVPFYTHLPTRYEPYFSVRDFGVSMDHNTVMRLYTTVFESSKEDTNEQVGKLGLGSKSPFAYSDSFTVTAWLNGSKRTYAAFIGAKYVPQIALMAEEPSDEPQGIEVTFPVKSSDEYSFKLAAQSTILGFDVLPTSNIEIIPVHRAVLFEGDGWKLFKSGEFQAHARQGCVVYPLDRNAIAGLTSMQRDMLQAPMLIDFPIGDLEITASREGLGYDEMTCANIKARLAQIEDQFPERVAEMTKACTSYFELLKLRSDMYQVQMPACIRAVLNEIKWKGKKVEENFEYVPRYWNRVTKSGTVSGFSNYTLNRYDNPKITIHTGYQAWSRLRTVFYVIEPGDVQKAVVPRIQIHRRANHASDAVVILHGWSLYSVARLRAAMGRIPLDKFINMKDVPKLPAGMSTANREKAKVRLVSANTRDPEDWTKVDIAADTGGLFVPLSRNKIVKGSDDDYSAFTFRTLMERAEAAGFVSQANPVYGIPSSLSRFYKNPDNGWKDVFSYLLEEAFKVVTKELYMAERARDACMNVSSGTLLEIAQIAMSSPKKINSGPFMDTVSFYRGVSSLSLPAGYNHALWIIRAFEAIPDDWNTWLAAELPHTEEYLAGRYPFLSAVVEAAHSSNFNHEIANHAIDYVNSIDTCGKTEQCLAA